MKLPAILSALALTVGCSTMVPAMQPVNITTNDPGATIIVDGAVVGRGSASTSLQRNTGHIVVAESSDGVHRQSVNLTRQMSINGAMDIVGGLIWLVPFVGVAAPGFWDLSTNSVAFTFPHLLAPEQAGS